MALDKLLPGCSTWPWSDPEPQGSRDVGVGGVHTSKQEPDSGSRSASVAVGPGLCVEMISWLLPTEDCVMNTELGSLPRFPLGAPYHSAPPVSGFVTRCRVAWDKQAGSQSPSVCEEGLGCSSEGVKACRVEALCADRGGTL